MSEMARHPAAFAVADWPERAPDRHPDTLEWVKRIEAVRHTGAFPVTRRCGICGVEKPLAKFSKNRGRPSGRRYECLDCDSERARRYRAARKRLQFRALLSQVAS